VLGDLFGDQIKTRLSILGCGLAVIATLGFLVIPRENEEGVESNGKH